MAEIVYNQFNVLYNDLKKAGYKITRMSSWHVGEYTTYRGGPYLVAQKFEGDIEKGWIKIFMKGDSKWKINSNDRKLEEIVTERRDKIKENEK